MTNDKGPATAGAPTPDDVESALSRLESYSNGLGDGCCSTIRAHVSFLNETLAALSKTIKCQQVDLAGLRKLDFRVTELKHKHDDLVNRCVQAESDRGALEAKLAEQIREDEMRLINHCVKVLGNNSKAHIHAEAEFLTKIAELEAENKRLAAELDFTERRMKHEADERDKSEDQNKRLREAIDNHRNCYWNCPVCGHAETCSDDDVCLAVPPLAQTGDK